MNTPVNGFKQALAARRAQIGLWLGLADPYCAEICAGAGFDWLALDAEHGPNTIRTLLAQLQAVAAYPVQIIVRAASGDPTHLKQLLDIGAQTLLVPLVETPEQARAAVRATRYPPDGVRGVGSALARAARWNRHGDYLQRADAEVCVLVQVESAAALADLDSIARVDGCRRRSSWAPRTWLHRLGIEASPPTRWSARRWARPLQRSSRPASRRASFPATRHSRASFLAGLQLRRGGGRHDAARPHDVRARGAIQAGRRRGNADPPVGLAPVPLMRKFDQSLPMALLRARELTMGYFRPMLNEHGLTEQQWRVIRVLQEYGKLEFHELSRVALIQPPSLTGILTRLERAALVHRTRSSSDQRRLHLSLSRAGQRRFETVSGEAEQRYGQIEQRLGRAKLRSLMKILREFDHLEPRAKSRRTRRAR
jgi:homoprotocatechuate degradation regulator HpaR